MSDLEEEEEQFCFYGKPLEPYDEDAFPKKKPVSIEDQVATDSHGRRRFHGAFTGGFSAGFFNTVGSLEGWRPSEFISSRSDKARNVKQKPQDFMDDEDVGEFGFAPEQIRATQDFNTSKKRQRKVMSDGPIPGEPVLESLISCGNDTVGYLLLKNIGLQDKIKQKQEIDHSPDKIYGCEMPSAYEISRTADNDKFEIPNIYKEFLLHPKDNEQGLDYSGLDKSTFNLFQSTKLVVHEKNKKLSISGQAFGVGAFENDDEDIYTKDDMNKYDFEMTSENKASPSKKVEHKVFDMFIKAKNPIFSIAKYPPPNIPYSFTGKHKIKKSRFEPVVEETKKVERKDINPVVRATYLGEDVNEKFTPSKEINLKGSNTRQTNKRENKKEDTSESENVKKISKNDLISGLIFDKFVSASQPDDHTNLLESVPKSESTHGTAEMRDAARMKMFGPLTRITLDWSPCALLCKRFNVPEPHSDGMNSRQNRKRTKHLIFEYEKHNEEEILLKPGLSVQKTENTEKSETSSMEVEHSSSLETSTNELVSNIVKDNEQTSFETSTTAASTSESIIDKAENDHDRPKDITEKINVDQNIDLFKAIFLSSDDEEPDEIIEHNKTDDTTDKSQEVTEEMKANVLSEEFVPKFIPKIKTNKEGILSNLDFTKINKFSSINPQTTDNNIHSITVNKESEIKEDRDTSLYGPEIPVNLVNTSSSKSIVLSSDSEDGWVEKGDSSNSCKKKKSHKHKKKHKKEHKKKSNKHSRKTC